MNRLCYWGLLFVLYASPGCYFPKQSGDVNRDVYEIKIQLGRLQEMQNDTHKLLESLKALEEQRRDSQFNALIEKQAEIEEKLQNLQEEIRTLRLHLERLNPGLIPADSPDDIDSIPTKPFKTDDNQQPASVDSEAFLKSARIQFSNGQYSRARVSLEKFIELDPFSPHCADAAFLLADTYFYENDFKEAGRLFLKLSGDFPGYKKIPDALVKTAICEINMDQKQKAVEILQKIVKDFPQYEDLTRVRTMLQDLNEK